MQMCFNLHYGFTDDQQKACDQLITLSHTIKALFHHLFHVFS